jgi:hypothetical protein
VQTVELAVFRARRAPFAAVGSVARKHLDALVPTIVYVNDVGGTHGNGVRELELPRSGSGRAPLGQERSITREGLHAVRVIGVRDEDVAIAVHRHRDINRELPIAAAV